MGLGRGDAVTREEALMGRDQLGLFGEVLRDELVAIDQRLAHSVRAVGVPMVALGCFGGISIEMILETPSTLFNRAINVAFETGIEFDIILVS